MSGRHESWQVRRWAPTALHAVGAILPAGALLSSVGAAGSGYLLHRVDIAAAGAGTAAVGLAVERLQNRSLRRRARRERWQWRAERDQLRQGLDELRSDLADAHHTLTVLRSRIHDLNERTAGTPRPALTELAARHRIARGSGGEDVPTMPVRRIGSPLTPPTPQPAASAAAVPARRQPAGPVPATAVPASALPANPLPRKPSVAAPAATGRPTPAGPERRRPLVTLAGKRATTAIGAGRGVVEPVSGLPPVTVPGDGPASGRPSAALPATRAVAAVPSHSGCGVAAVPSHSGCGVAVFPSHSGCAVAAAPDAGAGTGEVLGAPALSGTGPSIRLGPLATPPQLPVLPLGPAEPVRPGSGHAGPERWGTGPVGSGLPSLPPGPRDPASGPLAVVVDLVGVPRERLTPAPLPATAVDAMVYAAIAHAEADELTVTLERLDDPGPGRRPAAGEWPDGGAHPSGLVIAGPSVVGDPQARARGGRHSA